MKIIDKCEIKCGKCSIESILNNKLCISCNTEQNYYPLYNDCKNINTFIECYNQIPKGNCIKCDNLDYELIGNNCLEACNYILLFR